MADSQPQETPQPLKTFKELRAAARMKQLEAAYKLGVSISTVAALEQRTHVPSVLLAQKIAALFGVSVDAIDWEKIDDPKKTPQAA